MRGSRGGNDSEIAANSSEQRGQLYIVVENSRRATPNEPDHASGKFQHIAVTRPRQIGQRKRVPALSERGLDLPPDVAFAMRHEALERQPAGALLPTADNLKHTTRGYAVPEDAGPVEDASASCLADAAAKRRPAHRRNRSVRSYRAAIHDCGRENGERSRQRVDSGAEMMRIWGAHERVAVTRRAT